MLIALFILTAACLGQIRAAVDQPGYPLLLVSGRSDRSEDVDNSERQRIVTSGYPFHSAPSTGFVDGSRRLDCGPLRWLYGEGRLIRCEQLKAPFASETIGHPENPEHIIVPELPGLGISLVDETFYSDLNVKHKPDEHVVQKPNGPTEVVINKPIDVILHKPKPTLHHKPIKPLIKPLELKPVVLKPVIKPVLKPLVLKPIVYKPVIKPIHKPLIVKPVIHHAHPIKHIHKPIIAHHHHKHGCHHHAQPVQHLSVIDGHHPGKEQEHIFSGDNSQNGEVGELHQTGFGAVSEVYKASPVDGASVLGWPYPWNWETIVPADYSLNANPAITDGFLDGSEKYNQLADVQLVNDKIDSEVGSSTAQRSSLSAERAREGNATTLLGGHGLIDEKHPNTKTTSPVPETTDEIRGANISLHESAFQNGEGGHEIIRSQLHEQNKSIGNSSEAPLAEHDLDVYDERTNVEYAAPNWEDKTTNPVGSIDRDDNVRLGSSSGLQPGEEAPSLDSAYIQEETSDYDGKVLEGGPDVIEDSHGEQEKRHVRISREAPSIPQDLSIEILQEQQRSDNIIDRATLMEILSAFKEQYLKNAEPDQRKFIEDAIDRLHSSMRDMKKLEEKPKGKKIEERPEKAVLELLAEREPLMDEPDYYNDATDDITAEPSFMELLNVANKHRGKSISQVV